MGVGHALRRAIQGAGLDVTRFPIGEPVHYLVKQLHSHQVTCVLDVGANAGHYAGELRRFGYRGRIVSFEPLAEAFRRAEQASRHDPHWRVLPYALGPETGLRMMNVAGNSGHSSSFLAMLDAHRKVAPEAAYVASEQVAERTLDAVWDDVATAEDVVFLKLDVQGYERYVLDGARMALEREGITGIQLELSLVPLYEGAWLYDDAIAWAHGEGFRLFGVYPGFTDRNGGQMLQADALFFRSSSANGSLRGSAR